VVDASVFPRIPGFFIVTAIYMVAEKASALIAAAATAADKAGGPTGGAPSELRQVLARLPHPRKPARSTAVEEIR
jgi:choline dehydrogenase